MFSNGSEYIHLYFGCRLDHGWTHYATRWHGHCSGSVFGQLPLLCLLTCTGKKQRRAGTDSSQQTQPVITFSVMRWGSSSWSPRAFDCSLSPSSSSFGSHLGAGAVAQVVSQFVSMVVCFLFVWNLCHWFTTVQRLKEGGVEWKDCTNDQPVNFLFQTDVMNHMRKTAGLRWSPAEPPA